MSTTNHDAVRYSLIDDVDVEEPVEVNDLTAERATSTSRQSSAGPSTVNMFTRRLRGSQRVTFLAILLTVFVIIIWLLSHMESLESHENKIIQQVSYTLSLSNGDNPMLAPDGSLVASDLKVDNLENVYEWHKEHCYSKESSILTRSISDVYKKLQLLKTSNIAGCKETWNIFDTILKIEKINAPIVLPEQFQIEVKGWLHNNEKLFEQVNNQVIYKIVNKGTYEESVFNPIRSRRPVSKPDVDPIIYIKNLTESSQPSCDFCKYKDHTAEDIFGRIDNEYSASCSNTFKLAKFHALFFPKQHYPLNLSLITLKDLFLRTSKEWFEKAHEMDRTQRYPTLLWDCLPHSGASQVHPHVHGILDPSQYAGAFESWHQVSLQYYNKLKRSYWSDFVKLHFALGLGIVKGQAVVLTPLTARKDHEFMILAPQLNGDFVTLIYNVLQTYVNKLNVYCFSSGGVYRKMGEDVDVKSSSATGMPVIFRIGSRGTCTAVTSDVSSLELYTFNNINSDLDKTFNGLLDEIL